MEKIQEYKQWLEEKIKLLSSDKGLECSEQYAAGQESGYSIALAKFRSLFPDSIKPEDMIEGQWYAYKEWIFKFIKYERNKIIGVDFYHTTDEYMPATGAFLRYYPDHPLRPATPEEVLEYFPDEQF